MPRAYQPLEIPPGFYTEESEYDAGLRWVDGDRVRFRLSTPEPIGGWQKHISSTTYDGVVRDILAWSDLSGAPFLGFGTNKKLYVISSGSISDITPEDASGTLGSDPFDTTDGSAVVTVTHTDHGRSENDYVIFSGATAVGGITVDGEYTVTAVNSSSEYTITHSSSATSTATGGGASVAYSYLLPVGDATATIQLGWGIGTWDTPRGTGSEGWGSPAQSSTISRIARWSLDTWGEDLVGCRAGFEPFQWDTSSGVGTRAAAISNAPKANFILVADEARHLIAFGAEESGTLDPMLIRWSDQDDNTTWTAAVGNAAGDIPLQLGSRIVGALKMQSEILVWTDRALYSMRYVGRPFIFSIRLISQDCGLIGPQAAVAHDSGAVWLGLDTHTFYEYKGGAVRQLPCPVLRTLQSQINVNQADQIFAFANRDFYELTWLYVSNSSSDDMNDKYITYNYLLNQWYFGNLARTAWLSRYPAYSAFPIAAGTDGYLYEQENGDKADGGDMDPFIESGYFEIGEGNRFNFIDAIIPDFETIGTTDNVLITLTQKRYPMSTATTVKGPYTLTSTTDKVNIRTRGRQTKMKISSSIGGWRMGKFRLRMKADGAQ